MVLITNLSSALSCFNHLQAHSSCHYMLPKECGFGYLHKLVLPPYAVSMPNTTLWSSCSQNRCRSATFSGERGVINTLSSSSPSLLVENGAINLPPPSNSVFCSYICLSPCLEFKMFSLLVDYFSTNFSWRPLWHLPLGAHVINRLSTI